MSRSMQLVAVLALSWAVAGNAAAQAPEPKVVVTSKPIHALVAAVMEGAGTPALMVEGSASPHTYAMRPSDAQKVNRADVFFRVSEALEPFTGKIVRALPRTVKVVTLAEAPDLKLLQRRAGGPFEAHKHVHQARHGGHAHGSKQAGEAGGYDAHVWLDPENAKAMIRAIAATLGERAPQHAARFSANADAATARLGRLSASLTGDLAAIGKRPFVVLHDAYQYFEHRFGLAAIGSILVDPDEQPSVKRINDLRRKVIDLGAVCVFSEPNHSARVVASVTEGTAARMAVLDPEGTMLEPGPELYFKLMEQMASAMKGCLSTPA